MIEGEVDATRSPYSFHSHSFHLTFPSIWLFLSSDLSALHIYISYMISIQTWCTALIYQKMNGLVFFFVILADLKNNHDIDSIIWDVFSQRNFIVNSIVVKKQHMTLEWDNHYQSCHDVAFVWLTCLSTPNILIFICFFFQRQQTNKVRHSISNVLEQSDPDIDAG